MFWSLNRRDYVRQAKLYPVSNLRVKMNSSNVTHQVAGRLIELLALPLIHVCPYGVPIGAVEFGVNIDKRLHVIVSGWNLSKTGERKAQRACINDYRFARFEVAYIHSEEWRSIPPGPHLPTWLRLTILRDND